MDFHNHILLSVSDFVARKNAFGKQLAFKRDVIFLLILNLRIGHVFNEVSDLAEFLGQDMGSDCISS